MLRIKISSDKLSARVYFGDVPLMGGWINAQAPGWRALQEALDAENDKQAYLAHMRELAKGIGNLTASDIVAVPNETEADNADPS